MFVDNFSAQVNPKLGNAPPKTPYILTVSPKEIEIKMRGCCSPKSYVCAIENAIKCDLVKSEYCKPSLVLVDAENDETSVTSKFFIADATKDIDGATAEIETICTRVAALKRLQEAAVIIGGYLDPKGPPTPSSLTFYKPKEVTQIFNAYTQMQTAKVGTSETIYLAADFGHIELKRTGKGVQMLTGGIEGQLPQSVFVKVIDHLQFKLPIVEEMETGPDDVTEKVFRVRVPMETDDPDSIAVWMSTEVQPKIALECPFAAGLDKSKKTKPPKQRGRTSSRISETAAAAKRTMSLTSSEKPAEKPAQEPEGNEIVTDATVADKLADDLTAEPTSPPKDAKDKKGSFLFRKRNTSMSKAKVPEQALPEEVATETNGKK